MKIRQGFVSNSSSSSFIVFFEKVPKTAEEMEKLLFSDSKCGHFHSIYGSKECWTNREIAEIVFRDMQNAKPLRGAKNLSARLGGLARDKVQCPRIEEGVSPEESRRRFHKYYKAIDKKALEIAKELVKKYPKRTVYEFQYADDCGSLEASMEHGDLFEAVDHVKVSHH